MRYWKPKPLTSNPLVTVQIATYLGKDPRRTHSLCCLLACLQAQTYPNWEALVIHDGPLGNREPANLMAGETPGHPKSLRVLLKDHRIQLIETPERDKRFGHRWRLWAVEEFGKGDYCVFTNDDNYYAPVWLEWLLSELLKHKADFAYCDMVHSHKHWRPMSTKPKYKHLDLGGFMVKSSLALATPWTDFSFKGDGSYINALVKQSVDGRKPRVVKVPATLFVHN